MRFFLFLFLLSLFCGYQAEAKRGLFGIENRIKQRLIKSYRSIVPVALSALLIASPAVVSGQAEIENATVTDVSTEERQESLATRVRESLFGFFISPKEVERIKWRQELFKHHDFNFGATLGDGLLKSFGLDFRAEGDGGFYYLGGGSHLDFEAMASLTRDPSATRNLSVRYRLTISLLHRLADSGNYGSAPVVFMDSGVEAYGLASGERETGMGRLILGVGGIRNYIWGEAQLKLGAGVLVHGTYTEETDTLHDGDLVGAGGFTLTTRWLTVGDVLRKKAGSRWYLIPIIPKSKIDATAYIPVLTGEHNDGIVTSVQVQTGITKHASVLLDYFHGQDMQPHKSVMIKVFIVGAP